MNPEPETQFQAPLIVVSGPSGVGKTTVVDRLLAQNRFPVRRAITATTRSERPGEKDGISYHFWTVEQFKKEIAEGRMLEWEIVHGKDYYGIPRDEVDCYRTQGTGVILVIDVKGASTIRQLYPNDHVSVFISAPFQELEVRLRSRAAESEEKIQERLKSAREEIARAGEFDCTIINRDLERAVNELEQLLEAKFKRPKP